MYENVFFTFYGFTEFLADQVMVMPFFSMVIDKLAIDFTLVNTPGFFQ
jgi:hypothetical protein